MKKYVLSLISHDFLGKLTYASLLAGMIMAFVEPTATSLRPVLSTASSAPAAAPRA
jgi:hypothetical protein